MEFVAVLKALVAGTGPMTFVFIDEQRTVHVALVSRP